MTIRKATKWAMIFAWVSAAASLFQTLAISKQIWRLLKNGELFDFVTWRFPILAGCAFSITLAIFLTVLHRNQNQE